MGLSFDPERREVVLTGRAADIIATESIATGETPDAVANDALIYRMLVEGIQADIRRRFEDGTHVRFGVIIEAFIDLPNGDQSKPYLFRFRLNLDDPLGPNIVPIQEYSEWPE